MNATHPPSYIGSPRYDHQFRVWTNCASSINAQSASLNVRTGHQPPAQLDHSHLPRAPSSWLGGPRWFPVVPGGLLWFQVIIQQVRWSPSEHVDKLQSSMHCIDCSPSFHVSWFPLTQWHQHILITAQCLGDQDVTSLSLIVPSTLLSAEHAASLGHCFQIIWE